MQTVALTIFKPYLETIMPKVSTHFQKLLDTVRRS